MLLLTVPIFALIPALVLVAGLGFALGIARAGEVRFVRADPQPTAAGASRPDSADQEEGTDATS